MVLLVSFVQACNKGFNHFNVCLLTNAISSKTEKGYCSTFCETMRFNNFLQYKFLKWCSRSNHMLPQNLFELNGYKTTNVSERSKFLNKVSILTGYNSIDDLTKRVQKVSNTDVNGMIEEFDFTLACDRFPCIKIGDSSTIDLYGEDPRQHKNPSLLYESPNKYLPNSINGNHLEADKLGHTWNNLDRSLPNMISSSSAGENVTLLYDSKAVDSDGEANSKTKGTTKKSSIIKPIENTVSGEQVLDKNIRFLPRITNMHFRRLEDGGFYTIRKLLHHFPRTYADLRNAQVTIDDGQYLIFVGTVLSSRGIRASSSISFLEVVVGCKLCNREPTTEIEGVDYHNEEKKMVYLHLKQFFRGRRFTYMPFLRSLESKYEEGDRVYVSGKVKKMCNEDHYEIREYNIDMLEEEEEQHTHVEQRPYPLYPSKLGLKPKFLSDIILRALKILQTDIEPLPPEILEEFNLPNLCQAYMGIHRPNNLSEADLARRRLIFDEFFYMQLGRLFQMLEALSTKIEKEKFLGKYRNHELTAVCVEEWSPLTKKFLKALPYSLTPSQSKAVSEIIWDLKRAVPMNRLLQGDVGCGKTIVAFLACMEVIGSGFQVAFMVPTELLAVQHYEHIISLLENVGEDQCKPSVALLTGSTPSKQSRAILKGLLTGDIKMVIGTHSLIAEKVEFLALRIAVVDEQHRFGVIQRGRFNRKLYSSSTSFKSHDINLDEPFEDKAYMPPHILAMSATPIPRTLALALYGDMSLTQITDLPPGRTPVETIVVEGNEIGLENVFQMIRDELIGGGKIYLVYPVIEESEHLPKVHAAAANFESVSEKFEGYPCGLLHGRMRSEEKDDALRKFKYGDTRILLATQVIEIGVDVPDASMMVVMNAERFGIAQLHQLRGRVGRGTRRSKCVFVSSTSGAMNRVKVLEKSSDAFYLANADLLLRGPGNLLGKKQSGHLPEFPIARLDIDGNILQEAHLAALKVLAASNDLERFPRLKAELSMRQPLCTLGD